MQEDAVAHLLEIQAGVISRRQLEAAGWAPHDLRRALRRRDLAAMRSGVYVDHTGVPTWIQRSWSALLATSADGDGRDVALSHVSALRIAEGPGRRNAAEGTIHVAVPASRRPKAPAGVVVHRLRGFSESLDPAPLPRRIRYVEALLDVASAEIDRSESLALLGRAVGDGRTTAARILAASRRRSRVRNRVWLEAVLADVAAGSHSVLEHGFLTQVARPHALPDPRLQQRAVTPIGVVYRDALYGDLAVELDGRLHHSSYERRDADLDRDLFAAVGGLRTVRLGWGQVFGRPCRTAAALSQLVIGGGGRACGPTCLVRR